MASARKPTVKSNLRMVLSREGWCSCRATAATVTLFAHPGQEQARRHTEREKGRSEGNIEVGTVERRLCITTGEIGQKIRQHHPANASANRPGRTHLLVADQANGSGGIHLALEAAPVIVGERADD